MACWVAVSNNSLEEREILFRKIYHITERLRDWVARDDQNLRCLYY